MKTKMVLTRNGVVAYSAFEVALRDRIQGLICRLRADGTIGMSRDNLAQVIELTGILDLAGAPCGTNAHWMFGQMLDNMIHDNASFRAFVRG